MTKYFNAQIQSESWSRFSMNDTSSDRSKTNLVSLHTSQYGTSLMLQCKTNWYT